jgi:hypothetical protein
MSDVSVIGLGAMGCRALPAGFRCGPAYPDQMGFRTPSAPRVQDKQASP